MKRIIFITAFLLVLQSNFILAQNEKFKAIYMYNFIRNINWPEQIQKGNFIIGVLGGSPMKQELDAIAQRMKIGNQNLVIKNFNSVEKMEFCHILYIPPKRSSFLEAAITKFKGKYTLIITDKAGMAQQGAGINFIMDGNKILFEINRKSIEGQGLKISGSLIDLGKVVE
jgi:hypothetical protein